MPKPTFFNLPDEKRQSILEIAIEEFAENDYQSASISRMVARLGIAKGSFYQYFEDKDDLYFHVLEKALRDRLNFVQDQPLAEGQPFFEYVRDRLESGLRFDFVHPRLGRIMYRALFGGGPLHSDTLAGIQQSLLEYQQHLLRLGIAQGAIAPDIDIEIAARLLNAITANFSAAITAHPAIDPDRLVQGDYSQLESPELRAMLGQAMRILQYGLAGRPGEFTQP